MVMFKYVSFRIQKYIIYTTPNDIQTKRTTWGLAIINVEPTFRLDGFDVLSEIYQSELNL